MPEPCACGSRVCVNHNRAFFGRLTKPAAAERAVVFKWPVNPSSARRLTRPWTWCPVVNGEPYDQGMVMGHYDTLQGAYVDARAWTCGAYGTVPDAAQD